MKEAEAAVKAGGEKLDAEESRHLDPLTGMPKGGKIPLMQEQIVYVTAVNNVREFLVKGEMEEALQAARHNSETRAITRSTPGLCVLVPHVFQVSRADLVGPHTLPRDDEVIESSLAYGKELYGNEDSLACSEMRQASALIT